MDTPDTLVTALTGTSDSLPPALEMIRHEHDEIMALFMAAAELAPAEDSVAEESRAVMRTAALDALERHLDVEENVLHPAMRRIGEWGSLPHAGVERHRQLRDALAKARALDVADPEADTALGKVRKLFAAHRLQVERSAFLTLGRLGDAELTPLAIELEEARLRFRGAFDGRSDPARSGT